MSMNVAKWTLFLSLCVSRITSFLLFDFLQLPCWNCLELLPFLVHGSVCIWNLHWFRHRNKFVNPIVMDHRSGAFSCNAIFMFCEWRRFHSLPCGFMRFHCTTINRVGNLLECNFLLCSHLRGASPSFPLARHGCCNRSFQFSHRVFESFFEMLVVRID